MKTLRKVFAAAAVAALATALATAAAPTPAYADTSQPLCTNTTYNDGSTNKTKATNYGSNVDWNMAGTVKFALVECVVSGLPAGATVTSATLDSWSRSGNGAHTLRLHNEATAWVENTVTWNSLHTYDAAVLSSAPGDLAPGAGEWVSLPAPVTGNGTYRFALDVSTTTNQAYGSDDYLTDVSHRPRMTITWSPAAPAAPVASFTANPASGQAPLAVQFTDTSTGGPTSWAWDFGDGATSTAQSPSHTYAAAGTFTVSLTASNAGGSNTATQTVTVTPAPPPAPVASFTANPTSGTAPLSVQFTDTSTGTPTSWAWTFGDGGTSTSQNPAHTYAAAGTYTATLTASNAGGSTTASQAITASAAGAPVPTVPPGTVVPTTLAFSDEFNGTAVDPAKWTVTDGWTVNNVTTRTSNVTESGGLLHIQLATEGTAVTGGHLYTDYSAGRYQLPVGGFTEARVFFPGNDTEEAFNFPAWWSSGPNWPAAGELDIAEGLGGTLTTNYHGPGSDPGFNPTGRYGGAFHIFGAYRQAGFVDFYWDGVKVWTTPTTDNGDGQVLIFNVGKSNTRTPVLGAAGEVQVDWVRAWQPAASPWTTVASYDFTDGVFPAAFYQYNTRLSSGVCTRPGHATVTGGLLQLKLSYESSGTGIDGCGAEWYSGTVASRSAYGGDDTAIEFDMRLVPSGVTNVGSHQNWAMGWPATDTQLWYQFERDFCEGRYTDHCTTYLHYQQDPCCVNNGFPYSFDMTQWHRMRIENMSTTHHVKVYLDGVAVVDYQGDATTVRTGPENWVFQQECATDTSSYVCPSGTTGQVLQQYDNVVLQRLT